MVALNTASLRVSGQRDSSLNTVRLSSFASFNHSLVSIKELGGVLVRDLVTNFMTSEVPEDGDGRGEQLVTVNVIW